MRLKIFRNFVLEIQKLIVFLLLIFSKILLIDFVLSEAKVTRRPDFLKPSSYPIIISWLKITLFTHLIVFCLIQIVGNFHCTWNKYIAVNKHNSMTIQKEKTYEHNKINQFIGTTTTTISIIQEIRCQTRLFPRAWSDDAVPLLAFQGWSWWCISPSVVWLP